MNSAQGWWWWGGVVGSCFIAVHSRVLASVLRVARGSGAGRVSSFLPRSLQNPRWQPKPFSLHPYPAVVAGRPCPEEGSLAVAAKQKLE